MNIPCKECLVLPACIHKEDEIYCSLLRNWWSQVSLIHNQDQYPKLVEGLQKYLPKFNNYTWMRHG